LRAALEVLLSCDAETLIAAAGEPFDALTAGGERPLVLFGAGQMGQAVYSALRDKPVSILCFADNDPTRWGGTIDGLQILSPREAARRHGATAVFVLTFQAGAAALARQEARLIVLGVRTVCPFALLLRKWPGACGWPHGTPSFYRSRREDLESALDLFEDEVSRTQFLGHLGWRALRDDRALPVGVLEDQYFCSELVSLKEDECLVDGGAFDGDTLRAFLRERCEDFARIHAVEPDPASFASLCTFVQKLPAEVSRRIFTYEAAMGMGTGTVHIQSQGNHLSTLGEQGTPVNTLAVDDLPGDQPITFIKFDLEGSERAALAGARRTIARDRPVVAVAVYHHPADLFELPLMAKDLCPDYRFHLRTHNRFGLDVVLYAIPIERSR
jgi:FkbM family methyltransferase